MSDFEVLRVGGVDWYFALVGLASAALVLSTGCSSWVTIAGVVLATELCTALSWLVFAPYAYYIWQMPRVVLRLLFALARTAVAYVRRGCQPVFPEWTFRFEMARAAMRALRGGFCAHNIVQSRNSRYLNRMFEWLGKRKGPTSCQQHGTKMELVQFNGLEHVWIRDHDRSTTVTEKERFVVLYYHGGGFVLFAPHFFIDLQNRLRTRIMKIIHEQHPEMKNVSVECFLANYRKSPDAQYPIPQEDAVAAFEYLVTSEHLDPSRVVLMGDSAGGGLCLSTMLRLKAKGARLPGGAMLSCPFMGFDPSETYDDSHCVFALELGHAMAGAFHPTPNDPRTWKDAAALYCDLSGLPPALLQVGSSDTIYPSSLKLHEKAKADGLGATWELDVFPHMPHAFTLLSENSLPDAKRGLDHIAAFAARRFAQVAVKLRPHVRAESC